MAPSASDVPALPAAITCLLKNMLREIIRAYSLFHALAVALVFPFLYYGAGLMTHNLRPSDKFSAYILLPTLEAVTLIWLLVLFVSRKMNPLKSLILAIPPLIGIAIFTAVLAIPLLRTAIIDIEHPPADDGTSGSPAP